MSKTALITGITGQDGSFLGELLLEKGMKYKELSGVLPHSIQVVLNISTSMNGYVIYTANVLSTCIMRI